MIGSFPTYTIGNAMAAQLFETARAENATVDAGLARADYAPLRDRLADRICRHGRRYPRDELLRRATGRGLDPEPYIGHLTRRMSEIYAL